MNIIMIALSILLTVANGPEPKAKNVLGTELQPCCIDPLTGYYRDGFCNTGVSDYGVHTVCAIMTEEFLAYTSSCGNDLSTPKPAYGFPGLKPGDGWCLCVSRWKESMEKGMAPPVILEGCHEKSLTVVSFDDLKKYEYAGG
ncbi:MAG: hypothetical protein ACI86M_000148 [Saprospiraceae bacterium]|jgi:uncharacterized protein (DUF2237 family)